MVSVPVKYTIGGTEVTITPENDGWGADISIATTGRDVAGHLLHIMRHKLNEKNLTALHPRTIGTEPHFTRYTHSYNGPLEYIIEPKYNKHRDGVFKDACDICEELQTALPTRDVLMNTQIADKKGR